MKGIKNHEQVKGYCDRCKRSFSLFVCPVRCSIGGQVVCPSCRSRSIRSGEHISSRHLTDFEKYLCSMPPEKLLAYMRKVHNS